MNIRLGRLCTFSVGFFAFLLLSFFLYALYRDIKLLNIDNNGTEELIIGTKIADIKETSKQILRNMLRQIKSNHDTKKHMYDNNNNNDDDDVDVSYHVHAFYYAWYGTPEFDNAYIHWDKTYPVVWNKTVPLEKRRKRHPPYDIASVYYPYLGVYSSSDPDIIQQHMLQLKQAKIGVIIVHWTPSMIDNDKVKRTMRILLNVANKNKIKICFTIMPYKTTTSDTMKQSIMHLIDTYSDHPAFFRTEHGEKGGKPLFYINTEQSNLLPSHWQRILSPLSIHTIRNTTYDSIVLGLLTDSSHKSYIEQGSFDGCYNYYSSHFRNYGSNPRNWVNINRWAIKKNLLFVVSVGPGFNDVAVNPWNEKNIRTRDNGEYYHNGFLTISKLGPKYISISSFNNWHEGTQIEKVKKQQEQQQNHDNNRTIIHREYIDYEPYDSDIYLDLTRLWIEKLKLL